MLNERRSDGYLLSDDRNLIDVELVHRWLATDAYWAVGRTLEQTRNAIAGSAPAGVYRDGRQVAFARMVTDGAVFGYLADVYVDRLRAGNEVIVKIGTLKLEGTVSNIRPSVKNGTVTFNIELAESNHPRLRAGLKTDVHVISSFKESALRIANGSYYTGKGEYELWVVRGGEAIPRKLRLGDSNYEYVEVLEGLSPGEQVIVSNMDNYKNRKKVKVK